MKTYSNIKSSRLGVIAACIFLLFGCGKGGGVPDDGLINPPETYSIGGTVVWLSGSGLVLKNNGADDLPISVNNTFTFATKLKDKASYDVTVQTHPASPDQACEVSRGKGNVNGANVDDVEVRCVTHLAAVSPRFAHAGAQWNDYVAGTGVKDAGDTLCDGAGVSPCIHAGEVRVVTAIGRTSCDGLSATDTLSAFVWACDASTGHARFISTRLASGKYLSDLLDVSALGWRANAVTVFDGATRWGYTPSTIWWGNPVVAAGDGAKALDSVGTIYVANVSMVLADSYSLAADKVSLVVAPGAVIQGVLNGTTVVAANDVRFIWLEGQWNAVGNTLGISWDHVNYSRMDRVNVAYSNSHGVQLTNATNNVINGLLTRNNGNLQNRTGIGLYIKGLGNLRNTFTEVVALSNGGNGVELSATTGITATKHSFYDVSAINNGGDGILIANVKNNSLFRLKASNNYTGVRLSTSANNVISDLIVSNNNAGLILSGATSNIVVGATVSNNSNFGVSITGGSNFTFTNNLVAINNGNGNIKGAGVFVAGNMGQVFADLTITNNSRYGIYHDSGISNARYTGVLQVGNNGSGDCYINAGTDPGLDDNVHTGMCVPQGLSDFGEAVTGVTLANTFVAKVTTDDTQNNSDTAGMANFPTALADFDWLSFANRYRSWGRDGGVFPNANQQDRWSTGDGRIWDWSLRTTDNAVRGVLALPTTGNQTLTVAWGDPTTQNDAGCGQLVPGATWNSVAGRCESTFLRHAIEIFGDGIGNDNGLCESGETCLYTPNIGSYQGHGALVGAGTIGVGGTIQNVTLLKYEQNGN